MSLVFSSPDIVLACYITCNAATLFQYIIIFRGVGEGLEGAKIKMLNNNNFRWLFTWSYFVTISISSNRHCRQSRVAKDQDNFYFAFLFSRNLLFLKNYSGNVEDLSLNFTVVNNDLGESQVS